MVSPSSEDGIVKVRHRMVIIGIGVLLLAVGWYMSFGGLNLDSFVLFVLGLLMFPIGFTMIGAGLLGHYNPASLDPDYWDDRSLRRAERRWDLEETEEREESEHVEERDSGEDGSREEDR